MKIQGLKSVVFAVLVAAMTSACGGAAPEQEAPVSGDARESSGLRVTARTVESLAAGTALRLEARGPSDVITFDASQGPIDFSRIALEAGGQQVSMDRWLQDAASQKGLSAGTLEKAELTVKLDRDTVSLESWTAAGGPQAQKYCVDCCNSGYCCQWVSDCTYYPSTGQTYCTCSIWGCCDSNPQ